MLDREFNLHECEQHSRKQIDTREWRLRERHYLGPKISDHFSFLPHYSPALSLKRERQSFSFKSLERARCYSFYLKVNRRPLRNWLTERERKAQWQTEMGRPLDWRGLFSIFGAKSSLGPKVAGFTLAQLMGLVRVGRQMGRQLCGRHVEKIFATLFWPSRSLALAC